MIELTIKFHRPWEISTLQPDSLHIEFCGEHFDRKFQKKLDAKKEHKGCMMLNKEIPQQISSVEALNLQVLNVIITIMSYFLVVALVEKTISTIMTNFLLQNGVPIIMMCHVISINENLPGAAR